MVGGGLAGVFDLVARKQDRTHDTKERSADREAATSARREERRATERAAWRERAAVTLGQALEFATDIHPTNSTPMIRGPDQAQAKLEQLTSKWEALREPLSALLFGLPTAAERDLVEDVMKRLRRVFNRLTWLISDIGRERWDATATLELTAEWEEASAKLRELREAIQGGIRIGPMPLIDQTAHVITGSEDIDG